MARIRIGLPGFGRLRALYSNKSPVRRAVMTLGAVTFLAGVGLLAFGIVGIFSGGGSDSINGPPVVPLAELFTPAPPTVTPAVPTPTPAPPLGDAPFKMVIDKIGVDAPVITMGVDQNGVPEVPTGPTHGPQSVYTASVVVWYNFSAKPGTGSNAVFAGHVTWLHDGVYPAVFYRLPSLAPGDTIKLENDGGAELDYTVSKVFSVDANDPNARQIMGGTATDSLTIITCDGTFTQNPNDTVAGGSYNQRLVIRADLTPPPAPRRSELLGG